MDELERAIARRNLREEKKRALPRGASTTVKGLENAFAMSGLDEDERPTLRTELGTKDGKARVFVVVRAPLDRLAVAARAMLRGLGKR